MINYFINSSLFIVVSYLIYYLFLSKETFYQLNRYVLIGMLILSFTLPFINIPKDISLTQNALYLDQNQIAKSTNKTIEIQDLKYENYTSKKNGKEMPSSNRGVSIWGLFFWLYVSGSVVFLMSFIIQFFKLKLQSNRLECIKDGTCNIYELEDEHPPFSFLNSIYINPAQYDFDTYSHILEHEKIHITKLHFFDKLFCELLTILFWFNPFVWLYKKVISNNLEYQTDYEMISSGIDKGKYQLSLLQVSANKHPLSFTNNYNQSILEKRIIMMNSKKSSLKSIWKYLLILPLFIFTMMSINQIDCENCDTVSSSNANFTKSKYEEIHEHLEEITLETSFKNNATDNLLVIANISGGINVSGHNKNTIEVYVTKKITASSEEKLNKGIKEVTLGKSLGDKNIALYMQSPYSTFDKKNLVFAFDDDCNGQSCIEYTYQLDYTIYVPYNTNLQLQNVNLGDVRVKDIDAQIIKVNHITGSIKMENVSANSKLETVTGNIEADFIKTPNNKSRFKTVSGNIITSFPSDFSGQIIDQIGDGELKIDFDNKKAKKKVNGFKTYNIRNGESQFRYSTISGSAKVLKRD